jgi:hypothetical protein
MADLTDIHDCDFIQYPRGSKFFFGAILPKLKKLYTKSSKVGFHRLYGMGLSLESVVVMDCPFTGADTKHRFNLPLIKPDLLRQIEPSRVR